MSEIIKMVITTACILITIAWYLTDRNAPDTPVINTNPNLDRINEMR